MDEPFFFVEDFIMSIEDMELMWGSSRKLRSDNETIK